MNLVTILLEYLEEAYLQPMLKTYNEVYNPPYLSLVTNIFNNKLLLFDSKAIGRPTYEMVKQNGYSLKIEYPTREGFTQYDFLHDISSTFPNATSDSPPDISNGQLNIKHLYLSQTKKIIRCYFQQVVEVPKIFGNFVFTPNVFRDIGFCDYFEKKLNENISSTIQTLST